MKILNFSAVRKLSERQEVLREQNACSHERAQLLMRSCEGSRKYDKIKIRNLQRNAKFLEPLQQISEDGAWFAQYNWMSLATKK